MWRLVTRAFGSFSEPNSMAPVGQACWQAVSISPSAMARPSTRLSMRARSMRCTQ